MVFEEREKPKYPEETCRGKDENQQQNNPPLTPSPGIKPGPALVRGKCSQHCAIPDKRA